MEDIIVNTNVKISEQEIGWVKALCDGEKLSTVAHSLGVNKNTLATKLASLRDKLGCKNSIQLAAYFFRNKLIE